jgi:hypothetical protein
VNWNWEGIKEQATAVFAKAAQFLIFQMVCFYLLGCVVAHRPLGPVGYVSFAYHCFQWREGKSAVEPVKAAGAGIHE